MKIFAAVRWLFAWIDGDTSQVDARSTAVYGISEASVSVTIVTTDSDLYHVPLPRCQKCKTIYRPLVDGGRSCSLLCARCGGRPLEGRTAETVKKLDTRMRRARNIVPIAKRNVK